MQARLQPFCWFGPGKVVDIADWQLIVYTGRTDLEHDDP